MLVDHVSDNPGATALPHLSTPVDPILAVVLERVDRLRIDLSEHRDDFKKSKEKTDSRLESLETKFDAKLDPLIAAINKAAGGYLGIVGVAGIFVWATGLWDKIARMFH